MKSNWTPADLEEELKRKIIGQNQYLHDLSLCIWLHNQRRQHYLNTGTMITKPKYNMIVIGKSGMGKTSTIQVAAGLIDIPVVIEDASELRGAGWKGKQVASIIKDIQNKEPDDNLNQFSIVVLDEIDKVMGDDSKGNSFSPLMNLLKFVEGMDASYTDGPVTYEMNTENILFICMGAFDGLEEIIKKRINPKSFGFSMNNENISVNSEIEIMRQVTNNDLMEYGVSEQFLGRFPLHSVMNELGDGDYKKILLESEISPVKQIANLFFESMSVELSISENAADKIVDNVRNSELGVRGLQCELINHLKDAIFEIAEDTGHNKYRLDYNEKKFMVVSEEGIRKKREGNIGIKPFYLTKDLIKRYNIINVEIGRTDPNSIMSYVSMMFDQFMENGFSSQPSKGLKDIYAYGFLYKAKKFVAASIVKLIVNTKIYSEENTITELLRVIETIDPKESINKIYPGSETMENHLSSLRACSNEELEEIRELAWLTVQKYGDYYYLYTLGYGKTAV